MIAKTAQISVPVTAQGIPVFGVTKLGNITGRYDRVGNVNRFYGIPVAETTGGMNRFKEPQPKLSWAGTLKTEASKVCFYPYSSIMGQEDCLSVDIVAPNDPSSMPSAPTRLWS